MDNLSNPEVGANTSAAKAGARRDEITRQERHDMVWLRDAVLPDDGRDTKNRRAPGHSNVSM